MAMIRIYKKRGLYNSQHWVTMDGAHVMVDGSGNVISGAGGKLKGKQFKLIKSKSKDVLKYLPSPESQSGNKEVKKESHKTKELEIPKMSWRKDGNDVPAKKGTEAQEKYASDIVTKINNRANKASGLFDEAGEYVDKVIDKYQMLAYHLGGGASNTIGTLKDKTYISMLRDAAEMAYDEKDDTSYEKFMTAANDEMNKIPIKVYRHA